MKKKLQALAVLVCFLSVCVNLFAQQEEETSREYKPREQKLLIDIPLTIAEITLFNLAGNMYWRLWGPDSEVAYFTANSIYSNLTNPKAWMYFERGQGGDTFLVNQMFHPYAGGLYFAAARSNNFNFYWSSLFSAFGSISWEVMGETDSPASSDMINTAFGGIFLGEMLHRLYIELDKGGIAGKIGSTLLSPGDRITAALRGYGPEKGPSKISGASSLAYGLSWMNAKFFDDNDEVESWNRPSAFIDLVLVYNNPYTARSKTPFDHFEFNTSLTLGATINASVLDSLYNFTFIGDGYLASWLLADEEADQASHGLTLHFDNYITDKGFMDMNNGRENLSINVQSLGYTVKWRRILNKSYELSLKTHGGLTPWAVADYNGGINRDDYNLYLFGGNIKLFLELREIVEKPKNGQSLALSLCFYDTWNIPNTPGFDINTLFLYSKISWSFPLTGKLSFYAADHFMLLHCRMTRDVGDEFPNITRWYNNAQLGVKISL